MPLNTIDRPDWDTVFLTLAFIIAQRSPDSETKHGSVLVDKHNRILSLGFNGFPRGFDDNELPSTRPLKYLWVIHSETNALNNANIIPEPEKCTLYITGEPCIECSKTIIQHGIGKVKYAGVMSSCMHKDQEYTNALQKMMIDGPTQFIKMNCPKVLKNEIFTLLSKTEEYIKDRWTDKNE